ncbi:hypothetical protein [Fibrella aestuarina]|nr:hypothetical protein [Fibrella aestuarina]
MNALRQIVSPQNGRLSIDVPRGLEDQAFEVIVVPLGQMSSPLINALKVANNEQLSTAFWQATEAMQQQATQNGLTPERLDQLLSDED